MPDEAGKRPDEVTATPQKTGVTSDEVSAAPDEGGKKAGGASRRKRSKWTLDLSETDPAYRADAAGREDDAATAETEPVEKGSAFRLAAFGALLIVVLFAGYGLGRLNNGTGAGTTATPASTTSAAIVDENMPHTHGATGTGLTTTAGAALGGLSLSSDGLTLRPATTTFEAGRKQRLSFTIDATGGAPVTSYAIVHDKPLHLIVVRRDLTSFQHLHPEMAADGTWSIDLTLGRPGVYRMIADFTALAGGRQIATTLGTDLTVAGEYQPDRLPAPSNEAVVHNFTVAYEGAPSTQSVQPLLITVAGGAVEPYLGAYGHLVVLRQGDVAYLHVHPEQKLVDGKVKFWVTAPSPGEYRMFFDFQVAGQVHTAEWTLTVP
ncbi:hypothetical protein [Actinoplanes siamensis]|uniref:Secreted protein n=1 Tax=Actinoplanes siamensis TaxID=1223317 RepID=A0A919NDV2_9ACTN|nr:hypothetical protein [Actinoplanes siamensis]GIF09424.1 hypothetical protein Asi03nite_69620 [Actinoplanes siamensis]